MQASDILDPAYRILHDADKTRWTEPELLDYIYHGQLQTVLHRPDANAVNEALALVDGSKQSVPTGGLRFLRAVRNLGSDGSTPGRVVREVSWDELDAAAPDWHYTNTVEGVTIQNYLFDDRDPSRFYVYPAPTGVATTPVNLEVVYSAGPAQVTQASDTLTLPDRYLNPVLDWVLYRAFSKDAAYAAYMQRAMHHLQSFANELEVTMQINFALSGSRGGDMAKRAGEG